MRLLLDTHILVWWLRDHPALPARARALIADPENDVFVSPISLWEIAIKARTGKLVADADQIREAGLAYGFIPLPFMLEHAVAVAHLPEHHRDPFDRALIAQALSEPLRLLTHDSLLAAYGDFVQVV